MVNIRCNFQEFLVVKLSIPSPGALYNEASQTSIMGLFSKNNFLFVYFFYSNYFLILTLHGRSFQFLIGYMFKGFLRKSNCQNSLKIKWIWAN